MTKAQALQATLLAMAFEYTRKQVDDYREAVREGRVEVPHLKYMWKKYGDHFKSDYQKAKRDLALHKSRLVFWRERLKVLKSR